MITLWKTGHAINETVVDALQIGSYKLDKSYGENGFSIKNTHMKQALRKPITSMSYGILRGCGELFNDCYDAGVEYWEVDRGYFKPRHFDGYYRISYNNTRAKYNPEIAKKLPRDRWDALDINIAPWKEGDAGYVLLCPPTEHVASFFNLREDWVDYACDRIKQGTDRHIHIRGKHDENGPLDMDLEGAHCVFTFNSNVAVEALLKGVPAITMSPDILHWNNLVFEMAESPNLKDFDRESLFKFLSYCQFTLEEIKEGWPLQYCMDIQKYGIISEEICK